MNVEFLEMQVVLFHHYLQHLFIIAGKIRCWYWFSEDGLIVYSMSRSRYCENIGREHKSNHGNIPLVYTVMCIATAVLFGCIILYCLCHHMLALNTLLLAILQERSCIGHMLLQERSVIAVLH
jgi:hypothetical protein